MPYLTTHEAPENTLFMYKVNISTRLPGFALLQDGTCHYNSKNIGATDKGYMDIEHGDEHALMMAVATIGPISVAIDAHTTNFR